MSGEFENLLGNAIIKEEPKEQPAEQPADVPKEEPKEEPKETPEEPKETPKEEPKEEQKAEVSPFSFDSFRSYAKESFETEIESEDDLKTYFEKAKQADTLGETLKEKEQRISELTTLASKGLAGRDWFVSDDEFIRQQFLKNKSNEFSESALSVLSDLSPDKVKRLDAIKAIEISMMVENPDLEQNEVKALLEKEYGLEDGIDEMDAAAKAKLKVEGNKSRKALNKLFDVIEVPKAVNLEEQATAKREAWEKPVAEIVNGIDKLQITEDFAFEVSDSAKQGLVDKLMSHAMTTQLDVGESAAKELVGMASSAILEKNLDKIMKAYGDDIRAKAEEEWRVKVHNDKGLNEEKRSDTSAGNVMTGSEFLKTL